MSQKAAEELTQSRHYLPIRNEPKGRRIHIDSKKHGRQNEPKGRRIHIDSKKHGRQNAGKW